MRFWVFQYFKFARKTGLPNHLVWLLLVNHNENRPVRKRSLGGGTMTTTDLSQADGFWAKIRALLQLAPIGRTHAYAALGSSAGQNRPLDEELRRCWALAAERHVSLCVMSLEIDCFAEYLAAYGRDAAEDCMETLEGAIRSVLGTDEAKCLRMGQSGFVVILPDLPLLMARSLAGKIMKAVRLEGLVNKESHSGVVTLGCGISVVN